LNNSANGRYCDRGTQRPLGGHPRQPNLPPSPDACSRCPVAGRRAIGTAAILKQWSIERPCDQAFIELSGKPQVSNGQARCVASPCVMKWEIRAGGSDRATLLLSISNKREIGVPILGSYYRTTKT
jgi:hypothetical protein